MNKNFEIHTGQKERKEYIALTSVQTVQKTCCLNINCMHMEN